jgi:hypothetical protein
MTRGTLEPSDKSYDHTNEDGVQPAIGPGKIGVPMKSNWHNIAGVVLCTAGGMILADQLFQIPWLTMLAPVVSGLILLGYGLRSRLRGYLMAGSLIVGAGLGVFLSIVGFGALTIPQRVGIALLGLALGFGGITALILLIYRKVAWWPLIPFVTIGSLGFALSFTPAGFFDFVIYLLTGLGLVLLAVGVYKRLIGLIIPGCLLVTMGPGTTFAWGTLPAGNSLAQTGVMLVWYGLGWGLITLFSKVVFEQFVWWPLIPGGILAVVGWGLYIGGNPGNAVNFISNSGSIVMIIFGIYLLLMRRGIRH